MTNIKFHFYRWQRIFSKIIQWRTFSEFSHVSIEVDWYIYEAKEWKGVIKTKARKSPPKSLVETVEFTANKKDIKEALQWLEAQVGKGYDYLSLFSFVWVPKKRKKDNKWFCSEYATEFATKINIIEPQYFPTVPWGLSLLLK